MTTEQEATGRRWALPGHRSLLVGAVCVLALSTCASGLPATAPEASVDGLAARHPASLDGTDAMPPAEGAAPDDVAPPEPQAPAPPPAPGHEAPPAPAPAEQLQLGPVSALRPRLILRGDIPPERDVVREAMELDGVQFATVITFGEVPIAAPAASELLRVAAVEIHGFRVLVPQVTTDAVDVWHRIAEGDAAFTHDVGHRLGLELGSRVPLANDEHGRSVRVGAFASNGVPPIADLVVSRSMAAHLGLQGPSALLLAVSPEANVERLAAALQERTGLAPEIIPEPQTRQAFLTGAASRAAFSGFSYIDLGDGMISIDPSWVRQNIVAADMPVLRGRVLCHRLMIPQLRGALQEVAARGLAHLIDPSQYGGCWVPRRIDFNPGKPLSMHAWGLAIDLNVSTNQLGAMPQMDPRIVEIFDRWGFVWGGRWSRPDGMHFELGSLMHGG